MVIVLDPSLAISSSRPATTHAFLLPSNRIASCSWSSLFGGSVKSSGTKEGLSLDVKVNTICGFLLSTVNSFGKSLVIGISEYT